MKKFNIKEWRDNHLNEGFINEAKEGMQKSDLSKAKKLFSDIEKNQSDLLSNAKKLESVLEKYYAGGDNIHNVENGGKEDKLSRDASSYAVHSEAVLSETTGRQKLGHYFRQIKIGLKNN